MYPSYKGKQYNWRINLSIFID